MLISRLGQRRWVIEAPIFDAFLAATIALRVCMIAFCFVQSAWLAGRRLAIASTGVGVPEDRSVRQQHEVHATVHVESLQSSDIFSPRLLR